MQVEDNDHDHDFEEMPENPWRERCMCGLMRDRVGEPTPLTVNEQA